MGKELTRYRSLRTVSMDGVKEEIVPARKLPKRMKKAGKYSGRQSFLLEDGRYAYRDCDDEGSVHRKPEFYHVLTIEDENLLRYLEGTAYFDREEEKSNRREGELLSYAFMNFCKKQEADGDYAADPMDKEFFKRYQNEIDHGPGRPFPLKSEYAVIQCAIQQMTPTDRRVYELLYNSSLSDAEIKERCELEHNTWTNEKARFLQKMRSVFEALGYAVPGHCSTKAEAEQKRSQHDEEMRKIILQEEEEEAIVQEGRSIARERWELESRKRLL